ncbi:MAG: TIR domain-containing protein [Pseudomonadota bacterium]
MPQDIHVFVSYKREERHLTEPVLKALQKAGFNAVTDLNIARNTEFGDAIDAMIRAARLTIVLWTQASARSDWVRSEARLALRLDKEGFPNKYLGVIIEDADLYLPPDLGGLQMLTAPEGLTAKAIRDIVSKAKEILAPDVAASPKTSGSTSAALSEEFQLFETAKKIDVKGGYQRYLDLYPDGQFAAAARRELSMFRWYLHPFRRANVANTLTALSVVTAVGLGSWTVHIQQNPPGTVPLARFTTLETRLETAQSDLTTAQEKARQERDGFLAKAATTRARTEQREAELEARLDTLATAEAASREENATLNAELEDLREELIRLSLELALARPETVPERVLEPGSAAPGDRGGLSLGGLAPIIPPPPANAQTSTRNARAARDLPEPDCDGGIGYLILEDLCVSRDIVSLNLEARDIDEAGFAKIAGLTDLTSLNLRGTDVSSLEPLRDLDALTTLNLWDTKISDIDVLADLPNLEWLTLHGTAVTSLEPLSGLSELRGLGLNDTEVQSLEPLADLQKLERLFIRGIPSIALEPLSDLGALTQIRMPDDTLYTGEAVLTDIENYIFARNLR